MKATINLRVQKTALVLLFLSISILSYSEGGGTHPGYDPVGMSVPIDGGMLMAILAIGSLGTMFFKKKKDKK